METALIVAGCVGAVLIIAFLLVGWAFNWGKAR